MENMNWKKVCKKLRAASDEHEKSAERFAEIEFSQTAQAHRVAAYLCYDLMAALEAGMNKGPPSWME